MLRQGLFDHHRLDSVSMTAAGGTPTAQATLGMVPEGYAWYIENFAFSVVGNSHTAAIDVAATVDNGPLPAQALWDHQGLLDTFTAAVRGSQNNASAWYVPPAHFLRAYASGGTLAAGDVVVVTFQVAVHQLNPRAFMSPEDRAQVMAAHEREPEHLFADSATAARRAV